MAWIIDTLTNLPASLPPNIDLSSTANLSLPDLLAHLHSTNTIALHLILSSASRGFLTAILRRLAHLDYIARKAISHTSTPNPQNTPSALSPALKAAYVEIASLTASELSRYARNTKPGWASRASMFSTRSCSLSGRVSS